jgi:hypothetical protein
MLGIVGSVGAIKAGSRKPSRTARLTIRRRATVALRRLPGHRRALPRAGDRGAPIWELGFINGVGPRVEESVLGLIAGHAYSAPYEDLKLKGK